MENRKYPYLGRNYVNGKQYVVLFIEEEKGVVVMDETNNQNIKFGTYGTFAEELFEILPTDVCVRLSN